MTRLGHWDWEAGAFAKAGKVMQWHCHHQAKGEDDYSKICREGPHNKDCNRKPPRSGMAPLECMIIPQDSNVFERMFGKVWKMTI